ncbi:MAG TPA: GTP pyrophosphokinase family protein [Chitinispirillaceae bacterium]|nr:GTP pyrophosphokinase family protein [Chitinispirillaceae bacterium]
MSTPEHAHKSYHFKEMHESLSPEDVTIKMIREFNVTENLYLSATREIATKLEILNSEFKYCKERNPIHNIQTRVKTPVSILNKLHKRGLELSVDSARKNLTDIAGVRVICSYIDDIYLISNLLLSQNDIVLVRTSDYIKNPKSNGYRGLHHIITVPVFLSKKVEIVNVEIQIRTIAMDFWASLEHELHYKLEDKKTVSISDELRGCAEEIADIDLRMQNLFNITLRKNNDKDTSNRIDQPN